MICPKCGSQNVGDDFFIADVGPMNIPVQFHVQFCNHCRQWVEVVDLVIDPDNAEEK